MDSAYENFVENHKAGTFFQSFGFGEFQEKIPYRGKSWALLVKGARNDKIASCLVIKQKLRGGLCWLWVPYGPLLGAGQTTGRGEIFEDLARVAKEEKAVFARIEPPADWDEKNTGTLGGIWRIKPAKKRYTPEYTLVLDLDETEEEILAQMKPKGRYNIKVAERNGIIVKEFADDAPAGDFDAFYSILQKTGERDEFGIHPKYFYETLLQTLGARKMASLFLAYKKDRFAPSGTARNDNMQVVAGIIVVFYKDTAIYYYGASDYGHRNLMTPYLLQWTAIKAARARGMKRYDFLGITPAGNKSHPWAGVTEFKKKFGGREAAYPKAFDVVYRSLLYKSLRMWSKSL